MTAIPNDQTPDPAQPELVLSERLDGVLRLTLNHPEKRNTFSMEMLAALKERLAEAEQDKAVRALIIAANGPVFSSGHNIKEFVGAEEERAREIIDLSSELMLGLRRLPKPVIAQVAGLATAAGCQLVAICDLVVASREARFQTPGVMIGLFCSTPMVPLSRAIPSKKTMEMLLTGEPISAEEAERLGLVNRVVSPEKLEEETLALARKIISFSGFTIGLGKKAFYEQLPLDLPAAFKIGKAAMVRNVVAQDGQEGMSAFLEKRPPEWSD